MSPVRWIAPTAARVIERATGGAAGTAEAARAVEATFQRLFAVLETIVGGTSFRALLARSLHLAAAERPALAKVDLRVSTGVHLQGLAEVGSDGAAVAAAGTALLAGMLSLLSGFIGPDLTLSIVRRAWPGLAPGTAEEA